MNSLKINRTLFGLGLTITDSVKSRKITVFGSFWDFSQTPYQIISILFLMKLLQQKKKEFPFSVTTGQLLSKLPFRATQSVISFFFLFRFTLLVSFGYSVAKEG